MFTKIIDGDELTLTSEDANSFFDSKVTGESYRGDVTFVATLRALVFPRIEEGESIHLSFGSTSFNPNGMSREEIYDNIRGSIYFLNHPSNGKIRIQSFDNSSKINEKYFKTIEEKFTESNEGYSRLDKVTELYKESFKVVCYINPDKKNVILFIDNMDIRKMHYIQSGILGFLPWYFDPKTGVSKDELDVMYALTKKKADEYIACVNKIAKQYDFRSARIKRLLNGFENKCIESELRALKREIQDLYDEIKSYNQRIGSKLSEISNKEIRALGIETKISNDDGNSEIMNYFLDNKNIELENVCNDDIQFACRGYVDYYDEDMARKVIENERSYVYRPDGYCGDDYIPSEDIKMLMTAIFLEEELRIKFCASYDFHINGNIESHDHHNYSHEFDDCMPNPHIDQYKCMGNYSRIINELLAKHDYTMAIEQCIASCKSLNFGDSAVMNVFMKRVYGIDSRVNNKFIELPDGTTVTPKAAIKWLKEENDE